MPLSSDSESELAHDLIFRTDDPSRWGTGKGADLDADEIDGNFWAVLQLALEAIDSPLEPAEIQTISVVGDQMTIDLTNGDTFGPFTLPAAAFNWRGEWEALTDYDRYDIVTVEGSIYLVLQDHTSGSSFDPNANNIAGAIYQLMIDYSKRYDVAFFFPDLPGNGINVGAAMFAHRAAQSFYLPAELPGTKIGVLTAPTDNLLCVIKKNGTSIGSFTIEAGELEMTDWTFDNDVQFEAGDVLRVLRPTDIDPTATELTVTFAGIKGLIPEAPSSSA